MAKPRRLHRIPEIRLREGVSPRTVARHLGMTPAQYSALEKQKSLSLVELHKIAGALGVPVGQLVSEEETDELVQLRGLAIRAIKAAHELSRLLPEHSRSARIAQSLRGQILEVMPELESVGGLPVVGRKRTGDEPGRIAENVIYVPRSLSEMLDSDYS